MGFYNESGGGGGAAVWGAITGTLSDQTDLQTAINTQTKIALNASGDAPIYACRAWVSFDGTGTVAIRASGNVSSITDNGTGNYTVNFTTAMPDANYAISHGGGNNTTFVSEIRNADSCNVVSGYVSSLLGGITYLDSAAVDIVIFR